MRALKSQLWSWYNYTSQLSNACSDRLRFSQCSGARRWAVAWSVKINRSVNIPSIRDLGHHLIVLSFNIETLSLTSLVLAWLKDEQRLVNWATREDKNYAVGLRWHPDILEFSKTRSNRSRMDSCRLAVFANWLAVVRTTEKTVSFFLVVV